MSNFFLIFICLGLGMLLQRKRDLPGDMARALNQYVIYTALPALILLQIPEVDFSTELLVCVVMPWLMLLLGVMLVWIGWRIFSWSRATAGCLFLLVPLANTSFLGIPMVTAFFGAERVPYVIIYDQLGSFIALSTYGTIILAIFQDGRMPQPKEILRKIVTFPPFIAMVTAFILRPFSYPAPVAGALQMLSASLVPVVMVAIGMQLKIRMAGTHFGPYLYGITSKLVIAPLAALFICRVFNFTGDAATISVFEAGMPSMVTAGALAMAADLEPELAAALVGWGIVLSFLSLSGLYFLL